MGHSINPVPCPGGFGCRMCLAWSHAASQGTQDKGRWVGGVSPTSTGDKVSPGDILGDPDRLGVSNSSCTGGI